VVRFDAPALFRGLLGGNGRIGLIVSAAAAVATFVLVVRWRLALARMSAALAVAGIIGGWALAQRPAVLPGLTVEQAAAPTATLVAVIVAVLGGAVILFPSLALLFRLVLGGRFDPGSSGRGEPAPSVMNPVGRAWASAAGGCLVVGFALLTVAAAGWAHAVGVIALLAFVAVGTFALAPTPTRDPPVVDEINRGQPESKGT
jgi:cytochrome bd ubiquinol oxidase subunit II